MPECEICGKHCPALNEITVDSAEFGVCNKCADFGPAVLRAAAASSPKLAPKTPYYVAESPEFTIDQNYPKIIREARDMCNMSQEDLAKTISEKSSVVHRLETGKLNPSFSLARKLERFLSIKLIAMEK